jgi:hypothetical protein
LCCLFIFDIGILITTLVYSNSSETYRVLNGIMLAFNTTSNEKSVISWWLVVFVEETGLT